MRHNICLLLTPTAASLFHSCSSCSCAVLTWWHNKRRPYLAAPSDRQQLAAPVVNPVVAALQLKQLALKALVESTALVQHPRIFRRQLCIIRARRIKLWKRAPTTCCARGPYADPLRHLHALFRASDALYCSSHRCGEGVLLCRVASDHNVPPSSPALCHRATQLRLCSITL
jgi:hypothetical protein